MAEILQVDPDAPSLAEFQSQRIRQVIQHGGVIAFPTDTFYGLGVDPFNPNAVARLYALKQRPADKPILVLIHQKKEIDLLAADLNATARALITAFWPGRLTLLFPARPDLPTTLTAGTGKIGIRLPGSGITRHLLAGVGLPLTAPSANLSGGPDPLTAQDVLHQLGPRLDLIVDGGPTVGGKPSTLVDTTVSPPCILREGAISRQSIESALGGACG